MPSAGQIAGYAAKAQAHIDAFTALYALPYTVEIEPFSATILTLDVGAAGELVVTLTWSLNGVQQNKPDGDIQTWVVINPPLYAPDPRGTIRIGGIPHRRDPLYIARKELALTLQHWANLP